MVGMIWLVWYGIRCGLYGRYDVVGTVWYGMVLYGMVWSGCCCRSSLIWSAVCVVGMVGIVCFCMVDMVCMVGLPP